MKIIPEGLNDKLKVVLKTLKNLNWNTVAQGDMLYTKDMLQNANIEGENYLIFPNTIVYAISDSDLAKEIENTEFGIVWHTEYVGGPHNIDTTAKFGFNPIVLGQTPSVWHRDAIIQDFSGTVTLTDVESNSIMNSIKDASTYLKRYRSRNI